MTMLTPPPPPPPPAAATSPGARRRPGIIIGAAAAVAALSAGGVYLAQRDGTAAATQPTTPVTAPVTALTTPITEPVTAPVTAPETGPTNPPSEPDPTAPAAEDGTVELPHGVSFHLPEGFTAEQLGERTTRLDHDGVLYDLQVVERATDEDLNAPLLEVIDGLEGQFDSVAYSDTVTTLADDGSLTTSLRYLTYSADSDTPISDGAIIQMRRDDGLTVLVDEWASGGAELEEPGGWLLELATNLMSAPAVGPSTPMTEPVSFVPSGQHVTELVGSMAVAAAPGYTVDQQAPGMVTLSADSVLYEAYSISGIADLHALVVASADQLATFVKVEQGGSKSYDPVTLSNGVITQIFLFDGTAADNVAVHGVANYRFDPASGNGIWTWSVWDAQLGDTEPHPTAVEFMDRSLYLTALDGFQ